MSKKLIYLASMMKVLNLEVSKTYSIRSARKVSLFRDFALAVFLSVACSVLTSMPIAYGGEGFALEVNGSTLTIDDDEDVLRLSSYTYEFWMKDLEGPTGSWRNVFCKGPGAVNDGRGPLLALRPNEPGMHFSHSTGAGQETANTMEGILLNEWTHIALVLTDLNGEQIIYQDGIELVAENAPGLTDATQTPVLRIGIGANVALDDFRVWNYARTQAEIEADMNREVSGTEDGLVGYWRFNEGEGTTASDSSPYENHGTITSPVWTKDAAPIAAPVIASSPKPANGAILADTWVSLSWRPGDGAVSQDVYFGENLDDVDNGAGDTFRGNQTETFFVVGFPGFPYPDGLTTGKTYYWRIDGVEADGTTKHKGDIWSFTVPPKTAYLPDPADGAQSVDPAPVLKWTGGFGAKLHHVYFGDNFDDVNNAAGALPQGDTSYTPGPLKMARTYYWRVDEFDIVETHKGDVWSFTTEGAVESLDPADGAVGITQTPVLTWTPGVFGASHEVYFGTDADAVKNADTSSPEYKGSGNLGSESYNPGQLEWNTTYYWRVDEANNTNADSPWTGPLWSFTTANFLIVDDFESYNDLDPADPASSRIFNVWIDGFDNPAVNGS
ncbi:MAG: LamG domain-containing protein, partial [Planctomycetes bacterium]|nr:LamG domain-containing protein [Planctomycetota bacterium]